jgi:hypothetical protein
VESWATQSTGNGVHLESGGGGKNHLGGGGGTGQEVAEVEKLRRFKEKFDQNRIHTENKITQECTV